MKYLVVWPGHDGYELDTVDAENPRAAALEAWQGSVPGERVTVLVAPAGAVESFDVTARIVREATPETSRGEALS